MQKYIFLPEKAYFCTLFKNIFLIMPCILNIETSTDVCSVAVSRDGGCIFNKVDHGGPNHAVRLGMFVDEALAYVDNRDISLDAVAVSSGPGSYTGLRIGVSMAKGLCYARNLKLLAVPTLELLAVPVLLYHDLEDDTLLCPMLDARRMEVYAGIYNRSLEEVRQVQADVVDADTYKSFLDRGKVCFFGNGACKCNDALANDNAMLIKGIEPLAENMFPIAEKRMREGRFEDVAYFVPFYLKDFVAKTPRKML